MTKTKPQLDYETFLNVQEVRGIGFSERQLRKEYARLRAVAEKRIKRMSKTVFAKLGFYQRYKTGFVKTGDIKAADLVYELRDVARFLVSPYSKISTAREVLKKKIETAVSHGYLEDEEGDEEWEYNVEREAEYLDYFNFMREVEDALGGFATYDSGDTDTKYRRGWTAEEVIDAFNVWKGEQGGDKESVGIK